MLFIEYPKCSTCQKAKKWLEEHNIPYTDRHIVEGEYEQSKFWSKAGNVSHAGFHATKSTFVNAPLIDELPMALECRVKSFEDGIVGNAFKDGLKLK